jgi:hypothetical protein
MVVLCEIFLRNTHTHTLTHAHTCAHLKMDWDLNLRSETKILRRKQRGKFWNTGLVSGGLGHDTKDTDNKSKNKQFGIYIEIIMFKYYIYAMTTTILYYSVTQTCFH